MSSSLFVSVFVLIFLAELGDKTQLVAMARVAESGGAKWTVFLAASAALVASTFIAVIFGELLTRLIPLRYIQVAAALAFIIIGAIMLRNVIWQRPETAAVPAESTSPEIGLLSRLVLTEAAAFEKAAFSDYQALLQRTTQPELRALLSRLAEEERGHFETITAADREHDRMALSHEQAQLLPQPTALVHDVADSEDDDLAAHALRHERATAEFYRELAAFSPIPSLKRIFGSLAAAEERHVRELEAWVAGAHAPNQPPDSPA